MSITLAVLALVALLLFGCSRTEEDPIRTEAEEIAEIADPAEQAAAARAFLQENPTGDPEILGEVALNFLSSVSQHRGHEAAIGAADSMLTHDLPDYVRVTTEGYLAVELLRTETAENGARADEISRRLLGEDVSHPYGYTFLASQWLRTMGSEDHDPDPWLALDLAIKGSEKAEGNWTSYAGSILGRAYGTIFDRVEERRGPEAIPAVADSLLAATESPDAAIHLRGKLYDMAVEDDPEGAVTIAEAIESAMDEVTGGDVLSSVAYDLAERDLAPGLAVSLAERALVLTKGRWDSVYVLDTVGWAHHKAGNHQRAVSYLFQALDLMDEDPTYADGALQHLLTVYDGAGNLDGSIDLLVGVAARSLDPDAIDELARKLTARDGNPDALDRLLEENRYAGIEAAAAFALPDRFGETVALADLRGRVSLLCFWSYG
jgi:tetratricopeptide (TPR) repeat protein